MKLLFVHGWQRFSLAEWCLREALATRCRAKVSVRSMAVAQGDAHGPEALRLAVAAWRPELVGFSCHYWDLGFFLEAAVSLKHLCPDVRIVVGGPQVSSEAVATTILSRRRRVVDFVVRGPGEVPLAGLVDAVAEGRGSDGVPGLSHVRGGKVVHNPLPSPEAWRRGPIFEGANLELAASLDGLAEASYETLRGCRLRCAYCLYPGEGVAQLDTPLVKRELKFLCSFDIPNVRICDSHFGGEKKRALTLLRHLARVNRSSSIKIYPDLLHFDAEYAALVKDANAEITSVGVQTTNGAALSAIRRPAFHERRRPIEVLLEHFPQTPADVIVGLPGDDPAGVRQTLRDVLALGFTRLNIFRLTVFPGTRLAAEAASLLGPGKIVHTARGEVISSARFGAGEQIGIARLEAAARVVAPLRGTREAAARSGGAIDLLGAAERLDPDLLLELDDLLARGSPVALLQRFDAVIRSIVAMAGGAPELFDAAVLDVLRHAHATCRRQRRGIFRWHDGERIVRVDMVIVRCPSRTVYVWDLRRHDLAETPSPLDEIGERPRIVLRLDADAAGAWEKRIEIARAAP
jgi:radical SAM superfamily enzyme YgiQ (UPF0313 family)